jgi:hypothetical protein
MILASKGRNHILEVIFEPVL